uniref:Single-stranded DNA binding protein Ssb-like OB fold domain-containing protein n=2 Tax=Panagrolaimus TaxID=55784 RepID=A0A914QXM4_9BILA
MADRNLPSTRVIELKYGMKNIQNIQVIVLELGPIRRTVNTNEVRTIVVGDYTGIINFSVWNEYCSFLKPMDIIRIRGGIVNAHKRSLNLSITKSGDITKIGEFCFGVNESVNLSQEGYLSQEIWEKIQQEEETRRQNISNGTNGRNPSVSSEN